MIRRLTEADLDLWTAIRLEMLRRHPSNFWDKLDTVAAMPRSYFLAQLNDQSIYGLFQGGSLVGVTAWYENAHGLPEITHVYLTEDARGGGQAAALLEHVLGKIPAHRDVMLQANAGAGAAIRLYLRAGFSIADDRPELASGCDMVMIRAAK